MTYEDFQSINSRLIYASASGYGEEGPEAGNPGYDAVSYWARSGIESHIFPQDGWLRPFPYGSGDRPAGMNLLTAILLALFHRTKTGKGTKVSTSLLASGAWANGTMIQAKLCGAAFHEKAPRTKSFNFTYLHYKTKDGRIFKLNIHDYKKGWAPFCRAVGRPDLINDPRFAKIDVRIQNMEELIMIFDQIIEREDMAYWNRVLQEHDIPFAFLPSYDEIGEDQQMKATKVFLDIEHPRFGRLRTMNSPFHIEAATKIEPNFAPELGEHSREILSAMGYTEERIRDLFIRGIAK